MTCVCHRCGMDLLPETLSMCGICKGHYCRNCFADHEREQLCGERGQLSLRATPA